MVQAHVGGSRLEAPIRDYKTNLRLLSVRLIVSEAC